MAPLTRSRGKTHRVRRTVVLFCKHPVAQEKFRTLLTRPGFAVVVISELCLSDSEAAARSPSAASLTIVDGADQEATLKFVRTLRLQQPAVPVLVLLPRLDNCVIYPLLRLGVKGIMAYRAAPDDLARASGQVANGACWLSSELLSSFVESILPELHGAKTIGTDVDISRREREVLDLLLENLSNKEIAGKLFIAERTVKFHVSNLLSKFQVTGRADLIILWMQRPRNLAWPSPDLGPTLSSHVN